MISFAVLFAVLLAMTQNTDTAEADTRLDAVIAGAGMADHAAPGAAAAVWVDGEIIWSGAAGHAAFHEDGVTPARAMTANAPVRAASVSKLATALTAQALAEAGVVDLDAPIEAQLGFEPPAAPAEAVTIRTALAHTSGICDPAVYWAPLGESLADLVARSRSEMRCEHAAGQGWAYANINYGLVAQALESASGERFDRLAARHVLEPLGLDAGFNWAGVSSEKRAAGAALHRREAGRWAVQIDGAQTLQEDSPAILREPGVDLSDYQPGVNGTLFSPQGGLRAGAEDLAQLVAAFLPGRPGAALAEPVWTGEVAPGVRAWGSGPQILVEGQVRGRPDLRLVGHSGEAYGLYAGAWASPAHDATVAFLVTSSEPADQARDPVTGLTIWEEALLDLTLDVLERHLATTDARP